MPVQVTGLLQGETARITVKTFDEGDLQTDADTNTVKVKVTRKGKELLALTTIGSSQSPGLYVYKWDTTAVTPGNVDVYAEWQMGGEKAVEVLRDFVIERI